MMHEDHLKQLSDELVVAYVIEHNHDAYQEIVTRYQEKLARYARTFTRDDAVVADIIQETFINAFVHLGTFDQSSKFSSWIYRITHNLALNYYARKQRDLHFDEGVDFPDDTNIVEEYEHAEVGRAVHACLAQMPMQYAAPLSLHFLEGHSYEDVALILGLPIGTVGTRINRGKIILKKLCLQNKQ